MKSEIANRKWEMQSDRKEKQAGNVWPSGWTSAEVRWNSTESTHVVRVGEWVYKFLKSFGRDPRRNAKVHWRQIELRVSESRRWREFAPLAYEEATHCLISPFIDGPSASSKEASDLASEFRNTGRGYLMDISQHNVLVMAGQRIVIDFIVAEDHIDWRRGRPSQVH